MSFDDAVSAHERGDYATALREFRVLAKQGFASAQLNLGFMYDNGEGVLQDYAEAVKWYRLAAEQGHAAGQNNLGVLYGEGQGVPQDYVLAHMWFSLAAAQGNEEAVINRDNAEKEMWPWNEWKAERLARESACYVLSAPGARSEGDWEEPSGESRLWSNLDARRSSLQF